MASCEHCWLRNFAERKPNHWLSRLWHWHTRWCPGWKRYQSSLQAEAAEKAEAVETAPEPPAP
ncbi:MAG: hypothetical protein QM518_13340, partial [Verrucomicrobiota bacterium]|nr:hypothetical protein [Verrucomicrobiota bacterium]